MNFITQQIQNEKETNTRTLCGLLCGSPDNDRSIFITTRRHRPD